jgi:hypothetical protein
MQKCCDWIEAKNNYFWLNMDKLVWSLNIIELFVKWPFLGPCMIQKPFFPLLNTIIDKVLKFYKMSIKCWNLGLNAWGSKRFMVVVDITTTLIGWAQLGQKKEIEWNSNLGKLGVNFNFNPYWKLLYVSHCFLEISSPLWPNESIGVMFSLYYKYI